MSNQEAKQRTIRRFTNLLDGTVLPYVTPGQVIDYYQSLINLDKPQVKMPLGNIERQFTEAEIQYDLDEEDDYYDNNTI
jgi:hypothetical protein